MFQESGGQTKLCEVNLAPSLPAIIQMEMDSSQRASPCSDSQCRGWRWDVGAGPCLIGASLPTSQSSLCTGLLAPGDFGPLVTFLPSSPLTPTLPKCFHTCGTLTRHPYTLAFLFCGPDRNGKTHRPLNKHFLWKLSDIHKSQQKYTNLPRSHRMMPAPLPYGQSCFVSHQPPPSSSPMVTGRSRCHITASVNAEMCISKRKAVKKT